MSFFADIIADSRRRIMPTHGPIPQSGLLPVEPHLSESVQNKTIVNDVVGSEIINTKKPDTTLLAASTLEQESTAPVAPPITARSIKTDSPVLQDSVPSATPVAHASSMDNLTSSVVPTLQLKSEHEAHSNASPKVASPVGGDVNVNATNEIPDGALLTAKRINPVQEQLVEKSFTRPETVVPKKQDVIKQDDQALAQSVTTKIPQKSILNQSEIKPEVGNNRVAVNTQSRQADDSQSVAASGVLAGTQVELPVAYTRQVSARHVDDANKKHQPRVQIGQVNVVIEQPPAPRRRASAVAGNDDYASRNFLKSL